MRMRHRSFVFLALLGDTDIGLNVLGGVGFNPRGALRPYVQGKVVVADESSGSLAFGLRF